MTAAEPNGRAPDADVGEIQADIERTRGELGKTVEALSANLDAKKELVERSRAAAKPSLAIVASVAGVSMVGIIWWRRRSGRRHG
jgi:cobalamin biosynthesis Mg chelatase CobN